MLHLCVMRATILQHEGASAGVLRILRSYQMFVRKAGMTQHNDINHRRQHSSAHPVPVGSAPRYDQAQTAWP